MPYKRAGLLAAGGRAHKITVVYEGKEVTLNIGGSGEPLAVGTLQTFLDEWMPAQPGVRLDYVHGEETARELAEQPNTVAFLLPALHKNELFPAVEQAGHPAAQDLLHGRGPREAVLHGSAENSALTARTENGSGLRAGSVFSFPPVRNGVKLAENRTERAMKKP